MPLEAETHAVHSGMTMPQLAVTACRRSGICKHRPFPLTKDIAGIISAANNLDFVIISQFNEGVAGDSQDVRIYEPLP